MEPIQVFTVENEKDMEIFLSLPWKIYQNDPHWVPPLISDQKKLLSAKENPFFEHAKAKLFLARKEGEIVGRLAACLDRNYIEFHQEKQGTFGFFECIDDQSVANLLFESAKNWLKEKGMTVMRGPLNLSTNDECALLVNGFEMDPMVMMPYNPRYYLRLYEQADLRKAKDLYAYYFDGTTFDSPRLAKISVRLDTKGINIRPVNLRDFRREVALFKEVYNQAWSKNWGFVPMTDSEIDYMAKSLKQLVEPALVYFAFDREKPVGVIMSVPDYNFVLKKIDGKLNLSGMIKFLYYRRKIKGIRVLIMGVIHSYQKRGIEAAMILNLFKNGKAKGYEYAELSWILEDNVLMNRLAEMIGGKKYKTYRIYEMAI
ncbi:MAG: hypothetical protein AB1393_04350 [Candidatus Edwardsbacteria bacterium]